jgi:hypothetical protein
MNVKQKIRNMPAKNGVFWEVYLQKGMITVNLPENVVVGNLNELIRFFTINVTSYTFANLANEQADSRKVEADY